MIKCINKVGGANLQFGKDKTAIIKGIAIVFMIILHCGAPSYFMIEIPALHNQWVMHFMESFKICVGIFTFMVGYGYAFAKKKDWRYSFLHIKKLLIPFWVILFVFTLPFCFREVTLSQWLLNMFGVNSHFNWFSWFVAFFIYAMIVLPFMSKLIDHWPMIASAGLIILTYGVEALIHQLVPDFSENDWTQRLFDCMICSPGMIFGYLFAKEQWFLKICVPHHWLSVVAALLLAVLVFVARMSIGDVLGFNLDFFYAPLIIFSVLVIFNVLHLPFLNSILTKLGEASVYMWFFHALFFQSATRHVYQPFILFSNSLLIIIVWTIVITFSVSFILLKVNEWVSTVCHK